MNIGQMKQRCPEAEAVGVGLLDGYKLEFRHSGVATIIPFNGQSVPIVLWRITDDCERRLDVYEGFPRIYIKQMIPIMIDGAVVEAMAYVMSREYSKRICLPSSHYYKAIEIGYAENNIEITSLKNALLGTMSAIYRIS